MASVVEICNQALMALGARTINSLSDENESARLMSAKYQWVRDAVLADHPWNSAAMRTTLPADAEGPAFGWAYAYALPADWLRGRMVFDGQGAPLDPTLWRVENGKILTDQGPPLKVLYTRRISDPNLFEPLLREALAARLAVELCEAFDQSQSMTETLRGIYERKLAEARSADAQESAEDPICRSSWLAARR